MRQILCFVFVKYKPGTYYAHYVTNDSTIRKFHLLRCVCVCVCGVCVWRACSMLLGTSSPHGDVFLKERSNCGLPPSSPITASIQFCGYRPPPTYLAPRCAQWFASTLPRAVLYFEKNRRINLTSLSRAPALKDETSSGVVPRVCGGLHRLPGVFALGAASRCNG